MDISSATLFTELAPWASLVQRFGRCNRYGECHRARLFCIDVDETVEAPPYPPLSLSQARMQVDAIIQAGGNASPGNLPSVEGRQETGLVLRKRDFIELFNTDPDLSGQDIDISPYIRDTGTPQSLVFWRNFKDKPADQPPPRREELCPAAIAQLQEHLKKAGAWYWDTIAGKWQKLEKFRLRPGQTLLLKAAEGGYLPALGFVAGSDKPVEPIVGPLNSEKETYTRDDLSHIGRYVELGEHLADAESQARDNRLFAQGVWSGDRLPQVPLANRTALPETTLRLDLMRLGDGPMGPSWAARTQKLLADLGPFRLAWLETLVRIADWRASKMEASQLPQGEQA